MLARRLNPHHPGEHNEKESDILDLRALVVSRTITMSLRNRIVVL